MSGEGEKFVAALDLGTTVVRCLVIDQNGVVRGEEKSNLILEYPKPGYVEVDPVVLWDQVLQVIKEAVKNAGIPPSSLTCMSITTQRSSFLCWDINNNEPLCNIITWKDLRSAGLVKTWNSSWIREKIAMNQVRFGTLDTFLIDKLTDGEKHVTDYSCASPTGFFDPYVLGWADWALKMFSIPSSILPQVVPTVGDHFGTCKIFRGIEIPILCSIADQSASVFGSGLFNYGNVKVTLGTGAFLDVNTGGNPHTSVAGIFPLVGWKFGSDLVYLAEGISKDAGTIVEWGKSIGLYDNVNETSSLAESVPHSNGVFFIPAFNGVQAPYNDTSASAGFIGVTATAKKAHMVRALLESIAFRVHQLLSVMHSEADFNFEYIRADGGVARNDFILQTIANLTGKRVERPTSTEATALGCALMAGIHAGIWSSREEVQSFYKISEDQTWNGNYWKLELVPKLGPSYLYDPILESHAVIKDIITPKPNK
ncbi:unnamed protein product [Allacma fusca]|uniref:Glycerol kinase 5 n=1 Tax=Allacma fusca TaxID=39272 RepID=A0A8J2LYS7_9HEXA|nr:unnamed protein product [Allacma fusca]